MDITWKYCEQLPALSALCFLSTCKGHSSSFFRLKRKVAQKPLWINCWCIPERLGGRGLLMLATDVEEIHGKDLHALSISFAASIKACTQKKDLKGGSRLHAEVRTHGLLDRNLYIGNMLISMYAKCGALSRAQQVLHELHARDVVSWSALIAGFSQNGHGKEALECYSRMQSEGFSPDAITFTSILKACGIMKDIDRGKEIHDEIVGQSLLGKNVVLGTALVDMYAKCGALAKAQAVFDNLPERNLMSWSALISGYVRVGQGVEALNCFQRMQSHGIAPCAYIYSCIIKACGITGAIAMGESIYEEIVSAGLLERNIVIATAVVDMYAKCGMLSKAQGVLDKLPVRTVVSWNALIGGYVQKEQGKEAIDCYIRMQSEGLYPDVTTYACILKACGITRAIDRGQKVHDEIVYRGLLMESCVLGNALVDMYVTFGMLSKAQQVLNELLERDIVSWSTLIAGYAQNRQGEEALHCYEQLQKEGLSPNAITYVCILKACTITQNSNQGKQVHDEIVSKGLLDNNIVLGNALLYMYAKCALYLDANYVLLDELVVKNVSSWNALISGYVQNEKGQEVLRCYEQMQSKGVSLDAISYACFLKACSIMKELDKGKHIHNEIVSQGLLEKNDVLGNALVDMYVKCGVLTRAHQVLEELSIRNVISWSALIGGYAQHGQAKKALDCFQQMQSEGLTPDAASWNAIIGGLARQGQAKEALHCFNWMQHEGMSPNAITLVCVLNACSHSGLVDKGQSYFEKMSRDYGMIPDIEHQTCMIDLFARAGHFDRALLLLKKVSSSEFPSVWSAVLAACKKWGNLQLGKLAFEHAVD